MLYMYQQCEANQMKLGFVPLKSSSTKSLYILWDFEKETQGFIHCSFKAASLAPLNKQILSALATHDAWSLVITKPNFIWFGSTTVD